MKQLYDAARAVLDLLPTGPEKDALIDALLEAENELKKEDV